MITASGLTRVLNSTQKRLELNDSTRIILFSDIHRGVGDWSDDFAHNKLVFSYALKHYLDNDYSYIEIGDGDELWENKNFGDIKTEYYDIFELMAQFAKKNRLILIWGNHNSYWNNEGNVQRELQELVGLKKVYEGITIGDKIFVVHGHQVEFLFEHWLGRNISRFILKHIWKFLQNVFGYNDPTSPAKNFGSRNKVEEKIFSWAKENHLLVIAGHTHRPMFNSLSKEGRIGKKEEMPYYFNDGSCVHPRCITGIEIEGNCIRLVKWFKNVGNEDGRVFVDRKILEQGDLSKIIDSL